MKNFFGRVDTVINKVAEWGAVLAGILIVLMGFLTTYGVGRRYILNSPEPYSYELSVIFLTACILLAIPAVQRFRRNLRVDFIVGRMSLRWQNIFENIIVPVLALVFVGIVIWKSWESFLSSYQTGETSQSVWQEPLWPIKLLVPLCMGWLALVLISHMATGIKHLVRGTKPEDLRTDLTPNEMYEDIEDPAAEGPAEPALEPASETSQDPPEISTQG